MPSISKQNAKPSTLIDVIQQIRDAFSLMGDATPILVGKNYLSRGAGSPPRVVFVPEARGGKIGNPIEMGNAAGMTHTCEVFVRGKESGDDINRYRAVYALADRVISCIETAGTGRIEWIGGMADNSPVNAGNTGEGFGAELVFQFAYTRDVWHDPARWSLDPAGTDASGPVAHPPPGVPGEGRTIVPTTTPLDPGD